MNSFLPSWHDIFLMTPEIIVLITGLLILGVTPFVEPQTKRLTPYMALGGTLLAFLSCRWLGVENVSMMNNMFVVDNYALFFKHIFLLVCFLSTLLSIKYLEEEFANMGEYYVMMMFATLGMMLLAASSDLVGIYIALELMSISLYILAGFFRRQALSNESAIKYFLTGVFSSAFLIYGMSLIYGSTGTTSLRGIAEIVLKMNLINEPAMAMGMLLLMMGLGFKIGAVPFHMWIPDVYEGAPTSVTAFMSVGPKAAGFAAILRVFYVGLGPLKTDWSIIFGIIAVLTMTTGNLLALNQRSVKRMLAYSGIAHAGYAILGLAVAGTSMEQAGISAVLFYMFSYIFMNIGAFAMLIILRKKALTSEDIDEFNGLAQRSPLLAAIMVVFLLSLTGLPPTLGFVSKFYLFGAVIRVAMTGSLFYGTLATIAIINATIAAYYYFRVAKSMYLYEGPTVLTWRYSPSLMLVIAITVLATLLFGIFPGPVLSMAQYSVGILL